MKKLKVRIRPVLGRMVLWVATLVLFTQVAQARTLSEALAILRIQELKDKPGAPEFQLKDLNGNLVNLKDYKGKPILLYFWATW